MNQAVVAALSALGGSVVGSAVSVWALKVQLDAQEKRERRRLVYETAIAEYQQVVEIAKLDKTGAHQRFFPFATYLWGHDQLLRAFELDSLDENSLMEIRRKQKAVNDVYEKDFLAAGGTG